MGVAHGHSPAGPGEHLLVVGHVAEGEHLLGGDSPAVAVAPQGRGLGHTGGGGLHEGQGRPGDVQAPVDHLPDPGGEVLDGDVGVQGQQLVGTLGGGLEDVGNRDPVVATEHPGEGGLRGVVTAPFEAEAHVGDGGTQVGHHLMPHVGGHGEPVQERVGLQVVGDGAVGAHHGRTGVEVLGQVQGELRRAAGGDNHLHARLAGGLQGGPGAGGGLTGGADDRPVEIARYQTERTLGHPTILAHGERWVGALAPNQSLTARSTGREPGAAPLNQALPKV